MEIRIGRFPEMRGIGIPNGKREPDTLYRELIEPGWRVYEHFVDIGFFESVETNLPRSTSEHIEQAPHKQIQMEPAAALTDVDLPSARSSCYDERRKQ